MSIVNKLLPRGENLRILTAVTTALFIASALMARPVIAELDTALEDYVNQPDPEFDYTPVGPPLPLPGLTAHILHVTSQTWRSPEEVDRILWQHYLTIFVPDNLVSDINLMFVIGSDNDDGPPDLSSADAQALALMANLSGTVVSVIQQVPNQPLVFANDPSDDNERREDELVAFTFDRATRTGDYNWAAYLPMVKSVVRAMDVVQDFVPTVTSPALDVNQFVVTGFSKRGATAWLTAAVDNRVIAVAPGVFDALNWAPSLENHRASYGIFSDALEDYTEFDILDRLRTPEGRDLLQVIDPYSYRDRLTIPKFIINSSGDEFFPPNSSQFYLDALPDETLIRYLPNTNHGGDSGGLDTALQNLLAWYQSIVFNAPRPQIDWTFDAGGSFRVTTTANPVQVLLWQATNPTARDFRFDEVGPIWVPTPLTSENGEYAAQIVPPDTGWKGFFVELTFAEPPGLPQTYTTQLFITPSNAPFPLDQPIDNPRSAFFWTLEFEAALGDAYRYSRLSMPRPCKVFYRYAYLTSISRRWTRPEPH